MQRIERLLAALLEASTGVALALMIGVILWQVVLRYIFSDGLIWGEDFARIMMIYGGLIGAAVAHHESRHIRFDLLDHVLPRPALRLLAVIAELAVLATAATIAGYGWQLMIENESQESLTMGISMMYVYSIVPLGMGLIALASLRRIFALLAHRPGDAG